MSLAHPLLTVQAARQPEAYVIRVEGELDRAGTPDVESALTNAELSQADRIVLDLDRLRFIDEGGLRMLVGASRRSADNGNRLSLTRGTRDVARMFRLTLLDLTLPFSDPVDAQASAVTPERVGS